MKKRLSRPLLLAAVGAVILLAGILAWFLSTYCWVSGLPHRRDAQSLDLSGKPLSRMEALENFHNLKSLDLRGTGLTVADYDQLIAWHPDCQIRWDVPFQGSFLADDTEVLTLTTLTDADVEALSHMKDLKSVDASGCEDYAQLAQLQRNCPEMVVSYAVPIAGEDWPQNTLAMTVKDGDGQELLERLNWLPFLAEVNLQGTIPDPEVLTTLIQAYPYVDFLWTYEIAGQTLEKETRELELSGWTPAGIDELEDLLVYGPGLKKLVVLGSGLSNEQLLAFREAHPDLELVWDVTIEGRSFRTDITEMDMSEIQLTDVSQVEKWFPCFPDLTKVDMSHCGLNSETLDALNQKYEDIRIVWTISVSGNAELRTDAIYFMPYQLKTIVTSESLKDLKYCTDLICIDLGHMPITECEFVRYMPNLKYLIMADSRLGSIEPLRGHQNLVYLEIFITQVRDYSPLLECPALRDLNIANNHGDLTPLTQMTWLERLWIAPLGELSNKFMPEVQMLRDALPNTQVEYSPYSTGMNWRIHPRYYEMRDILGMYYMK